jgi:16S rRNA C967 or C1407 C5-methylase (RsmB/RsmF family)
MRRLDSEEFKHILARAIGAEKASVAFPAFREAAPVAVRVNPFKVSTPGSAATEAEAEVFARACFGPSISKVPWNPLGYLLPERPVFTLDPLFHAGCYYVQDASAQFAGYYCRSLFDRFSDLGRPVRVLDLCAAPGGKTTDLAASLRTAFDDGFLLVANEVMRNRASVLADNVSVWGDPNVTVTSVDPKAFASMEGFFDLVLTDVPCSGEGMFRKDPEAFDAWSEAVVDLCASRQRRILADAWPALRQGGILLYTTCTFEESENDANVEWITGELGAELVPVPDEGWELLPDRPLRTRTGYLLIPGFVRGEGQFAAAVVKTAAAGSCHRPEEALERLRPLRFGMPRETRKGTDLVPSADMALCFKTERGAWPEVDLGLETALRFLRRDNLFLKDAPLGFVLVCYEGHPLGFVKNLGRRSNNLHPQSRRIRMELPPAVRGSSRTQKD